MARRLHRLSARTVATQMKPGYHPDGGGLYLQVTGTDAKSWIFRYARDRRSHEMGIGSVQAVSLAAARDRAQTCRGQLATGADPLAAKRDAQEKARLAAASTMTFKVCAETYIDAHRAGWRNAKHGAQWQSTLETYAYPILGKLPIQAIDTALVMRVLEPIWQTKTETASRVRGRIEAILDWATVRGYRQGENPARWRGHLDHLLPARARVQQVVHHPALPYVQIRDFMSALSAQLGAAAKALAFQVLTASRTGEVIGAQWQEFDAEQGVWTVPAARMKTKRDHRVPLSYAARDILEEMKAQQQSDYVFPGLRSHRPLSNMALLQVLKRMKRDDITAHGFRSTFRDWAAEATNHSREVAEMALAHTLENKVEAAYRRGDLFEKRRCLMEDWASYCVAASQQNTVLEAEAAE
jgi:integrase